MGNLFFFGNDSFHHCLRKPTNTKTKNTELKYFGASTDAQFTRHHNLLETNEIIKVASGDFHSLFLTRNGRVIVAGKNKVSFIFESLCAGDSVYCPRVYAFLPTIETLDTFTASGFRTCFFSNSIKS